MPRQHTDPTFFTEYEEIINLLDGLRTDRKVDIDSMSDVHDANGLRYVDLVMEGGGVLGVALVGYTYVLEEMGLRFIGLGGTSAGSINAMALSGAGPMWEKRSIKVLNALCGLDMYSFVDGDSDARDFVDALTSKARFKTMRLGWKGMQVIDNLTDDLGLNPGDAFERWMDLILRGWGVHNNLELTERRSRLPEGLKHKDEPIEELTARLAIIAAEVGTETKVEFPDMAELFWKNPEKVSPAKFVRASMSIPFFFQPFQVKPPTTPKPDYVRLWANRVSYRGVLPKMATFIDGGIMSNFPINVFHRKGAPTRPTFGVKLGTERMKPHDVSHPMKLLGAVFNSARHTLDFDFLLRNPDFRRLITVIDTGDHNWLNFSMKPEEQRQLFVAGAKAAAAFLREFDWADYKRVREAGAREPEPLTEG